MKYFYLDENEDRVYFDVRNIGIECDDYNKTFRITLDEYNSINVTTSHGMTLEPVSGNKVNIKQFQWS